MKESWELYNFLCGERVIILNTNYEVREKLKVLAMCENNIFYEILLVLPRFMKLLKIDNYLNNKVA
jgi:hypothetical protein